MSTEDDSVVWGVDRAPAQQEHAKGLAKLGWQYFECPACGSEGARAFPKPEQQEQTDWEAVAADQSMTIALLKAELQEFANKQADAVEVALTESGWVWDGDQWQRPAQRTWVGLTDEEYSQLHDGLYQQGKSLGWVVDQVEAKLKAKNAA